MVTKMTLWSFRSGEATTRSRRLHEWWPLLRTCGLVLISTAYIHPLYHSNRMIESQLNLDWIWILCVSTDMTTDFLNTFCCQKRVCVHTACEGVTMKGNAKELIPNYFSNSSIAMPWWLNIDHVCLKRIMTTQFDDLMTNVIRCWNLRKNYND